MVPELMDEMAAGTCPQVLSTCMGLKSHGQMVHPDFPPGLALNKSVTNSGLFCLTHSKPKHGDAEVCSKEKPCSQGSQVRKLENKSQIRLPEGMGSEYLS